MPRHGMLLLLSLPLITCKGDSTAPILTDRVVVAGPSQLIIGQTGQFTATVVDTRGNALLDRTVSWASSDTGVVTINQSGLASARAIGTATVSASADGKTGTAPLSITVVPVARVDVAPAIDSLFVGDSLQLTAITRDNLGGVLAGRTVTWHTSDSTKATVSSTGLVRTRSVGSFAITATSEGKTGGVFLNAQFRVVAIVMPESLSVGLRHQVRLIPNLQSETGTHLSGRPLVWTSSNPAVLEAQQDGKLVPHQLGIVTVVARADTLSDSSVVTVTPEPVAAILVGVLVPSTSLADSTVEAFEATPYDAFGFPTTADTFTWASSDTTILRIEPSPTNPRRGLATGRFPGTVQLTVTSGAATHSFFFTLGYPLVRLIAQPDSMTIITGTFRVITVIALDRFGHRFGLDSRIVTSADSSIVRVAQHNPAYIEARQPGRTTVEIRSLNGLADTVPVVVPPTNAARLTWTSDFVAPSPYTTRAQAVLISADSSGAPSNVPRDIQILSSDTTVAVPVPATLTGMVSAKTITVLARAPGHATFTAVGDSQFAALYVTVYNESPSSLQLDSTPAFLQLGDLRRLKASVKYFDDPRPFPVTWTTSDASVATVSDSGVISAVGLGDVTIIARSGTVGDTARFAVVSAVRPVVSAVTPLPLAPGAVVTIKGSGFDADPAANVVLIDSIAATVIAASESTLSVLLPPQAAWPCRATHTARVLIRSGDRLGLDSLPLSIATPLDSLAVGAGLVMVGPEAACAELTPPMVANSSYFISAANTSIVTPLTFALQGEGASGSAAVVPTDPGVLVSHESTQIAVSIDSLRRAALLHRRLLDGSRALARRAGAPAPLLRAARHPAPFASVPATINNVARVRIPKLENPDFCSSYRSIDARIVYAGTRAVLLEDRAAPLAGQMDAAYVALGQEFDSVMYPILIANFGNPLVLDSLLDRDGRIAMVFSPIVNTYGVAGFVVSCDFYPEAVAPSSNTGEIFYAQVPNYPGSGFGAYTAEVWLWLIRSVVMHEAKHLTAYAERLSRAAPMEDTWLEEASAVVAEELWSRPIYHSAWKGNATYGATLYCDVRPTFPECAGRPYSMFNAFAFLNDYLRDRTRRTPLGPTSPSDATFYGSGWALLRWTIDQTAGVEHEFLRRLVQQSPLTGVANLTTVANRPFGEMLSDWSGALYSGSWGKTPASARWKMPSWNLQDIFFGMRLDFPNDFPDPIPLRGVEWRFGANVNLTTTALPPGGFAPFVSAGGHYKKQLLVFRTTTGAPLPNSLRILLLRLQ